MVKKAKGDLMSRVRSFRGKGKPTGRNTHFIGIRLPADVKREIEAGAASEGVSLNSYVQELMAVKATGRSTPDAIEEERGLSAEREIRRELLTSVTSAGDIRQRLDGLRHLCRGMLADAERTLRAGHYSFWRGEPDKETQRILTSLETELVACSKSVSEARAAILAARPGKASAEGKTLWEHVTGEKQ